MPEAALRERQGRGRTWVDLPELLALRHARFDWPLPAASRSRSSSAGLAPLRARGMEFAEVRAWQPGDDPRHMHWKATARSGRPYTKLYQEESERPTLLCVDLTSSMHFATAGVFKAVLAARVAMLIAWWAAEARDRVSGLVLTAGGCAFCAPLPARRGALRLAACLAQAFRQDADEQSEAPSPLDRAIPLLRRHAPSGSRLVLISDFLDAQDLASVSQLGTRRPLLIVRVYDRLDRELPPPGRYAVHDGSGEVEFDSGHERTRHRFRQDFDETGRALMDLARVSGGAYLQFRTDQDPAQGPPDATAQQMTWGLAQ
ncbi:DUF58 domain-containing protein [Candidatus Foliamicus sp.]